MTQGAGRAPVPKGVRHRDCYTPTLVWAVTIEMHRTPPYEVGGWGRPQLGRLVEKQRRHFSSCQVGKRAGCLLMKILAGTPPAQYSLFSPPLGPFPNFCFLIYNETNRVGALADLGPSCCLVRPHSGPSSLRHHRSPQRWLQVMGPERRYICASGPYRSKLGPLKIQRPPRRGWFHVAFRARAPGFSIGLLAYGECQGFPVCPHAYSLDSAQRSLTASSSTGPEGPVQPMHVQWPGETRLPGRLYPHEGCH